MFYSQLKEEVLSTVLLTTSLPGPCICFYTKTQRQERQAASSSETFQVQETSLKKLIPSLGAFQILCYPSLMLLSLGIAFQKGAAFLSLVYLVLQYHFSVLGHYCSHPLPTAQVPQNLFHCSLFPSPPGIEESSQLQIRLTQ